MGGQDALNRCTILDAAALDAATPAPPDAASLDAPAIWGSPHGFAILATGQMSADEKQDVWLTGFDPDAVDPARALGAAFKLDETVARGLVAKVPIRLKQDAAPEVAAKFVETLGRVGAFGVALPAGSPAPARHAPARPRPVTALAASPPDSDSLDAPWSADAPVAKAAGAPPGDQAAAPATQAQERGKPRVVVETEPVRLIAPLTVGDFGVPMAHALLAVVALCVSLVFGRSALLGGQPIAVVIGTGLCLALLGHAALVAVEVMRRVEFETTPRLVAQLFLVLLGVGGAFGLNKTGALAQTVSPLVVWGGGPASAAEMGLAVAACAQAQDFPCFERLTQRAGDLVGSATRAVKGEDATKARLARRSAFNAIVDAHLFDGVSLEAVEVTEAELEREFEVVELRVGAKPAAVRVLVGTWKGTRFLESATLVDESTVL